MTQSILKKESYFRKCSFCKIFESTDKAPSGLRLHSHDYTQIWYVTKGECEHRVENQVYRLTIGDTFLLLPEIEHQTLLGAESSAICCEFSLEAVLGSSATQDNMNNALNLMSLSVFFQDSKEQRPRFLFRPETSRRVEQTMRSLLQEYEREQPYYEEMLRTGIQELLLLFMREFSLSSNYWHSQRDLIYLKYKEQVAPAIRYIDENCASPLTLDEVCRISALSKTYFCYLFKLITKQTFVEYLTAQRIRASMDLLENRAASIAEISEQLGFNNVAYFSKIFKKLTGSSPSSYRRNHLQK